MEKEYLVVESTVGPSRSLKQRKFMLVFASVSITTIIIAVLAVILTLHFTSSPPTVYPTIPEDPLERAKYLATQVPVSDTHNDLPWMYRLLANDVVTSPSLNITKLLINITHTDIPRLREGKIGAQWWSVYVECGMSDFAVQATLEQIDVVYQMAKIYPNVFQLADTVDEIYSAFSSGRIASLIGMEGGHSINSSLGTLRMFRKLGATYMTLTHTCSTPWAQSANDNSGNITGLTQFGREVVLEMNKIGMMVDISHVAPQTMLDALNTSLAPVIFSHSNAKTLCNVPRNVPDEVLLRLPKNGGVIMVVFYPDFVCEGEFVNNCSIHDLIKHIDYIKNLIGVDYIGFGSDFDGVPRTLTGLEDVSKYPVLLAELIKLGYSDSDILKISSQNILRVKKQVEVVSQQLNGLYPQI